MVLSAASTLSTLPTVPKNLRRLCGAVGNGRSILGLISGLIARTMAGIGPVMAGATSHGAGVVPATIRLAPPPKKKTYGRLVAELSWSRQPSTPYLKQGL